MKFTGQSTTEQSRLVAVDPYGSVSQYWSSSGKKVVVGRPLLLPRTSAVGRVGRIGAGDLGGNWILEADSCEAILTGETRVNGKKCLRMDCGK